MSKIWSPLLASRLFLTPLERAAAEGAAAAVAAAVAGAAAGACDVLLPLLSIISMIASVICGSAHEGSGTMPMSGRAATTTSGGGMSLGAPSSSVRMRAALSRKDMDGPRRRSAESPVDILPNQGRSATCL